MSYKKGGDIAAYVGSANDVLTAGNYNEMDGLVLAELSYIKFEDMSWTADELKNGVSLQDFARKAAAEIKKNTDFSNVKDNHENIDKYYLLKAVAESPRYKNCTVTNMSAVNGTRMWDAGRESQLSDDAQWAGMTIRMNDKSDTSVVAMRGTDGTTFGWEEDFEIGKDPDGTTAQIISRDYLKSVDSENIYMTGHSKGGNDVSSAYVMNEKDVRDRVKRIDNYDGPGQNEEFVSNYQAGYLELDKKQHNYYPEDSIIGQLLKNNPGENTFIPTSTDGHTSDFWIFNEHDPFSWNGSGGEFEETQQSELSKKIDKIVDNALSDLTPEEQADAINHLLHLELPASISGESSWENFLNNIKQDTFISDDEKLAFLKLVYCMLSELISDNIISYTDSKFSGFEEFYSYFQSSLRTLKKKFREKKESAPFKSPSAIYDFDDDTQGQYAPNVRFETHFSADPDQMESLGNGLIEESETLKELIDSLKKIKNDFPLITSMIERGILDIVILNARRNKDHLESLGDTLKSVAKTYRDTDAEVAGRIG